MEVTFKSYWAGGGLFDVGLMDAGIDIVQAFDLDKAACKTYQHNLGPHMKISDLSKETVLDQKEAIGHIYTYPCNRYSPIANISGTLRGDEQYLHALRHLAIDRPEVFILENVPGILKFEVVVEAMIGMPDYFIKTYCPMSAQECLPQRRDRLIIIGTRRPFRFREPDFKNRVKLADILEENPRVTLPKAIKQRMNGVYRDLPIISDPANDDIAPTAISHYSKDKSTRLVRDRRYPMGVRPYSVREYARLQGVPDWFEFPVSDTDAYKIIGNGVPVPFGQWIGKEVMRYFKSAA